MQKITFTVAAVAVVVLALGVLGMSERSAMAECQKRHSFDTCFHTLNR